MIKDSDISFIIQGELKKNLYPKIAQTIRNVFPEAEIVLSTYQGSDIKNLDYDQISLIKDPGYFNSSDKPGSKPNNINRQIKTTLAGLKIAKRKYAFKLRSDFLITGNGFLNFYKKFQSTDDEYQIFNNKLLALVFFTRNPRKTKNPFPFHPSDIAFFGLKSDLENLFNIQLMKKEEELYFLHNKNKYNRYVSEQYLWINCLRKNGKNITCDYQHDANDYIIEESERFLVSNFICLDYMQFCLSPPEKMKSILYADLMDVITHIEWQGLYQKYIYNGHQITEDDSLRILLKKQWEKQKKYKKISKLLYFWIPFKRLRRFYRQKTYDYLIHKYLHNSKESHYNFKADLE